MEANVSGEVIDPRLLFGLVASSEAGRRISVFQEFSENSINLRLAYEAIVRLPATLFEPLADWPTFLAMRAIGLSGWRIRRIPAAALAYLNIPARMPFWVLFSADAQSAEAIAKFQKRQRFRPLHISLINTPNAVAIPDLTFGRLKEHVLEVIEGGGAPGLGSVLIKLAD